MDGLKVGELARRTGLSVRTLHYYDEIGLLRPSRQGAHRLYLEDDVARLHRIVSLRGLGFSLEEIRVCLDQPDFAPLKVVEMHLERVERQLRAGEALRRRLEALADSLRRTGDASAEDLMETVEAMTVYESYYTDEQKESLARRKEAVGAERIREVEAEWRELFAEVSRLAAAEADPAGAEAQAIAKRWQGLVDEFTGADKGIERNLARLWQENPDAGKRWGFTLEPAASAFVAAMMTAYRREA